MVDFKSIAKAHTTSPLTEPSRVFKALANKQWPHLRGVQDQVLAAWHPRRDDEDLVIKMNTGAGKTIVGLLILQSSLNEGKGPAVFVTPDRFLLKQAVDEAKALGVEHVVDDPHDAAFQGGRAILITTLHKVINGFSAFGVSHEGMKIHIGTIVLDDAHACIQAARDQFTLSIPRANPAYDELLRLLATGLSKQITGGVSELQDNEPGIFIEVPFYTWQQEQDKIRAVLRRLRNEDDFKFVWPLIKAYLPLCDAVFTSRYVEIAPSCVPVEAIPSLESATRRVYLTATLADDSVLVTSLGANPDTVSKPIVPRDADDLGDRMILMPEITAPEAGIGEIRQLLVEYAKNVNVVVIVPSARRAGPWREVANAVLMGNDQVETGIKKLQSGLVGLTVLINRYDGIDLPDDACRILVLDGLPRTHGLIDESEARQLEGSQTLMARQIQRIEQGMGRGLRSNEDYCAVLLLGKDLTAKAHHHFGRPLFTAATQAQLELSDDISKLIVGEGLMAVKGAIDQCLAREQSWRELSRGRMAAVDPPTPVAIPPAAILERQAFNDACLGRFTDAADKMSFAAAEADNRRTEGYMLKRKAEYLNFVDPVGAQEILIAAQNRNRNVTRPLLGTAYTKLDGTTIEQADACVGYLSKAYDSATSIQVSTGALLARLTWDDDPRATKDFESAISELGLHLGFKCQLAEQEYGNGPDVLWLVAPMSYFVIECKSGSTSQEGISRSDTGQLANAENWFKATYEGANHVPVMVHPLHRLSERASTSAETRIIWSEKLTLLKDNATAFFVSISKNYTDPVEVRKRLNEFNLTAAQILNRYSSAAVQRR